LATTFLDHVAVYVAAMRTSSTPSRPSSAGSTTTGTGAPASPFAPDN